MPIFPEKKIFFVDCFIWQVPLNLVACLPVSYVFLLYCTSAGQGSTYRITGPRSNFKGFVQNLAIQLILCVMFFIWKEQIQKFIQDVALNQAK